MYTVFVDVPAAEVKGYLEEREVTLTCEVHGFLQSTNPPVWQGQDGSPIDSSSSKYVISSGSSSFPSVLVSNRSVVSGFRSTLTIRQLSSEDAGRYICVVDGNSSLIQLSVVPGTSPPPPTPTSESDSPTMDMHVFMFIHVDREQRKMHIFFLYRSTIELPAKDLTLGKGSTSRSKFSQTLPNILFSTYLLRGISTHSDVAHSF